MRRRNGRKQQNPLLQSNLPVNEEPEKVQVDIDLQPNQNQDAVNSLASLIQNWNNNAGRQVCYRD